MSASARDHDDLSTGATDDAHSGPGEGGQGVLGEHLGRTTVRNDAAAVHEHQPVGVLSGQGEIVHRRQHGDGPGAT